MNSKDVVEKLIGQVVSIVSILGTGEVGLLCEAVCYYEDGIKTGELGSGTTCSIDEERQGPEPKKSVRLVFNSHL